MSVRRPVLDETFYPQGHEGQQVVDVYQQPSSVSGEIAEQPQRIGDDAKQGDNRGGKAKEGLPDGGVEQIP